MICTASTGTAAVNLNGCTTDSLLKLIQNKKLLIKDSNTCFNDCEYIVIDEISMIDGAKFDEITKRISFINKHRENCKPIKLIICGDCMQLPPINSVSGYFFNGGEFGDFEFNAYTCKLKEVKRQNNKQFIELLERVRIGTHTSNDVKYINNMKNNTVSEDKCIYMCAKNKDVAFINKKFFDENLNEPVTFKKKVQYHMNRFKIDKLPSTNKIVEDIMKRGDDITLKQDMRVMVTENIDVINGICNGTVATITKINKDNVELITESEKRFVVEYYKVESRKIKFDDYDEELENHYSIVNDFMPLVQCNAITIHKSQGATLNKCILNCDGIFEKSMFYTGLSRIIDPKT